MIMMSFFKVDIAVEGVRDDEVDDVNVDLSDCLIVVDVDIDVVSVVVLSVDDDDIIDVDGDDDADVPVDVCCDDLDDDQ